MPTKSNGKKRTGRDASGDNLASHRALLKKATDVARRQPERGGSPHPSVRVGAVLVDRQGRIAATAANRFAHGVDSHRSERYASGRKSLWINCAEQMAIASAAKKGRKISGGKIYVTLEPCAVCAGIIAECGISEVFVPVGALRVYSRLKNKWKQSIEIGMTKLAEAGVKLTSIDAKQSLKQ